MRGEFPFGPSGLSYASSREPGVAPMELLFLSLFIFNLGVSPNSAFAVRSLPPVGVHYPLFVVEKNENPQNILVAYTKLDDDCRVQTQDEAPFIDYYWLMDRERYKPVHRLIKRGIRNRLEIQGFTGVSHQIFDVRIEDLKELKQDLGQAVVSVVAGPETSGGGCEVQAYVRLGPSDEHRTIKLDSIFTESRKTIWPPFRKIESVTLRGTDALSKKSVERTYFAR